MALCGTVKPILSKKKLKKTPGVVEKCSALPPVHLGWSSDSPSWTRRLPCRWDGWVWACFNFSKGIPAIIGHHRLWTTNSAWQNLSNLLHGFSLSQNDYLFQKALMIRTWSIDGPHLYQLDLVADTAHPCVVRWAFGGAKMAFEAKQKHVKGKKWPLSISS